MAPPLIEVDEGNHENCDSDDEKEREGMFKKNDFKIFQCNPNDSDFDLFKSLGEINLYLLTLREENAANKAINKFLKNLKQ